MLVFSSYLFAAVSKWGLQWFLIMNILPIGYNENFAVLFFIGHQWRCDRVLIIPLGENLQVLFLFSYFLCNFLELRLFVCHSASCMQDFVPKSIIT